MTNNKKVHVTFDPKTQEKYQKNPAHLLIEITKKGCEGNKIQVKEIFEDFTNYEQISSNLHQKTKVYIKKGTEEFLKGGRLTFVKGKWILTSKKVLTRCGCGSSFSFKSGNEAQDKIALLRKKLKTKKQKIC